MRIAFVDVETTGLDPNVHEMIEFAAIVEEDGKEVDSFRSRIRPKRIEIAQAKALECNGYDAHPELWASAPPIEDVAPIIAQILRKSILAGHNVGFDEAFLVSSLARAGVAGKIPHRKIDTICLAYEHLSPLGLKSTSMDAIREFLGWEKKTFHDAYQDAQDARRLFHLCWRMGFVSRLKLRSSLAIKSLRKRSRNDFR